MINRWLVRPLLKVTTWVKRNPLLALLLVLLLWFLPSPLAVLNWLANAAINGAAKIFGGLSGRIPTLMIAAWSRVGSWLAEKAGRCYWVGLAVLPFAPFLGAGLMLWCSIQSLKGGPAVSVVPLRPEKQEPIGTIPVPVIPDESDNPFDFGFPI